MRKKNIITDSILNTLSTSHDKIFSEVRRLERERRLLEEKRNEVKRMISEFEERESGDSGSIKGEIRELEEGERELKLEEVGKLCSHEGEGEFKLEVRGTSGDLRSRDSQSGGVYLSEESEEK